MFRAALIFRLLLGVLTYVWLLLRPNSIVAAENLFLRRQLALYQERNMKPRRTDPAARLTLAWLSQRFDWRSAVVRKKVVALRLARSSTQILTHALWDF